MRIAVIGCGVVGAAIAYELSLVSGLEIAVFDRQPPAQAATGASLGVLMGAISQKTKGKAWALRQASITRYESLIPELEAATGKPIPHNSQGILMLEFDPDHLPRWEDLIAVRQTQGWPLELWEKDVVQQRCPHIQTPRPLSAIYSPRDRQVDPTALTLALVEAARLNGATFHWDAEVEPLSDPGDLARCAHLQTRRGQEPVDWVVIAAGLGSTLLSQTAPQPLDIRPVLGQALRVRSPQALGDPGFQPVISGEDIHLVPLGDGEYWVGATVEFPAEDGAVVADAQLLQQVWQGAIALCPGLTDAAIVQSWSGLRPRPHNRPAPIIEPLTGFENVLLATGHYRNGVLLAPATALIIRDWICSGQVFR